MVFVCIVLAVILVFVLVRHLHFVWQIKSINEQIEFINTHETNKIVTGEYRNGSITDLINNINALSRQCSILKTQCLTNESNMKETITNISHDIRTPLTSLSGYFQLMCQCNSSAEREKYSKIISQQISILQEMLEELFTYAKLSSQSYEITSEKCCINQILRDMVLSFYHEFKNANITPDISIPEKPIYIWANDMALRRVFQNVLKNVIEHGGKFVCISLIEMNSVIEITFHNDIFHDTDIDTARVFDRFYKSDIAKSSLSTGLGLSIAKELLDKMNGDISANVNDNIFEIVIKLEK